MYKIIKEREKSAVEHALNGVKYTLFNAIAQEPYTDMDELKEDIEATCEAYLKKYTTAE